MWTENGVEGYLNSSWTIIERFPVCIYVIFITVCGVDLGPVLPLRRVKRGQDHLEH